MMETYHISIFDGNGKELASRALRWKFSNVHLSDYERELAAQKGAELFRDAAAILNRVTS